MLTQGGVLMKYMYIREDMARGRNTEVTEWKSEQHSPAYSVHVTINLWAREMTRNWVISNSHFTTQ